MVRKVVVLNGTPERVTAWLTADCKYLLYVNGRLASRGPVDIGRDYAGGSTRRWFYDARDLTPLFRKGRNVIAAEVFRDWPVGSAVSRGRSGFLFEAGVALNGVKHQTIVSDATWRGMAAAQFPNPATYDAAAEPDGWRLAGFDDASWHPCEVVPDVWEPLVPSEIPPCMEVRYRVLRIDGLASRRVTADTTFRVVFDRVLSGYPAVRLRGGRGATVTIRAHDSAVLHLAGSELAFEFPFLTEIAPSFTVEVKGLTEPLEIEDVGATFTSQPVAYRGAFACSDPRWNRLWDVSRWAVQICLQTHHLDSPNHQEPICDPGDYVIESIVNYYAFGLPWLTRQDVRKFAWLLKDERYHNFHTSYSIYWLQMLLDCYDYTGDAKLVREMAPYVHQLLDTYAGWIGKNGLVSEAPNYMFMDWVTIGGFECHHPPAVIGQGYLTALYYHGLAMGMRVAALTGDSARVEKYEELRRSVRVAFERELWSPKQGLYRDGKPFQSSVQPYQWLPADRDIETFSPHVNMLAVLYDLAPRDRQQSIVDRVMSEKPLNTQPWFMHWVFQALDHAGLFEKYAPGALARWHVVPETQSFREMWTGGDLSHGWCSTPLVQMSARVLGVTPSSPGFKTFDVRPRLCGLEWARGSVPTPRGDVAVSWSRHPGDLRLDLTVPAGAEATIEPPIGGFAHPEVKLDGRAAAHVAHAGPGIHHVVVTERPAR